MLLCGMAGAGFGSSRPAGATPALVPFAAGVLMDQTGDQTGADGGRSPREASGLRVLRERYATFFVDQFGVLHDGAKAYPGAVDALRRLKASGAHVVLISNSGRPAAYNAGRLADLGFDPASYDAFVTSGDVALDLVARGALDVVTGPSTRCLTISGVGERSLAGALGFSDAESGEDADFVIIAGSRGDVVAIETYARLLEPAARRGAPCLCTNPDQVMLTPSGPAFGAGRIALLYEQFGGAVTWVGKPYPEIYEAARRVAGAARADEIACVGDSVEHDIVGARRFGARAILVRTGINAGNGEDGLAEKFARHGVVPDEILDAFRW